MVQLLVFVSIAVLTVSITYCFCLQATKEKSTIGKKSLFGSRFGGK